MYLFPREMCSVCAALLKAAMMRRDENVLELVLAGANPCVRNMVPCDVRPRSDLATIYGDRTGHMCVCCRQVV